MSERDQVELPTIIANADNLPSVPAVALEVLRQASDDGVGIEDLAATISRDPALSAKILKLSNSSLFRRGAEVTSIDKATMLLGIKTVKLMALSFSLASNLPKEGDDCDTFDYNAYWRYSLTTAVAGRSLARLVKSRCGDEAFLCGLLGRIGQLVMAQAIPDEYGKVLDATGGVIPTMEDERRILGYDFYDIGGALLKSWELPELIHDVVRLSGDIDVDETRPEATRDLARLMYTAGHATTVICDSRKGPALQKLHQLAQDHFDISEPEIDAFLVGLQSGINETAALLNIELGDTDLHQKIIDQARLQMVQISLGNAVELQATTSRAAELEEQNKQLEVEANTDKLTGINNRAFFDRTLTDVIRSRANGRAAHSLGLLVLDVDNFKVFNDTHGHTVGDVVLKEVAQCLLDATRDTDFPARYGGEEFVVIVPETTSEGLMAVAERIRTRIEQTVVHADGKELGVTISIGGACTTCIESTDAGPTLLKIADECLYEAKESGRNRSICRVVDQLVSG